MVAKTTIMWKSEIFAVLESKAIEFQLMGYAGSTPENIWKCMTDKVWKGNPEKRLYEVVQDIFHLNTALYISYLTVQAYQDDDLDMSISALVKHEKTSTVHE
ncbi:Post-transcriptional regulator [Thalassobacillus cyri]|uniref:Post-transcriptional regulator n=1 Tax=Thalassobacillus cyri TaxID=571932 RepID=A0A1H4FC29_9BACI|nr:post-transcriptional regulator [Thalassobacillus cyri]SEA94844.1 Post-transcriptional regulator [Thalassobacillus cyri]